MPENPSAPTESSPLASRHSDVADGNAHTSAFLTPSGSHTALGLVIFLIGVALVGYVFAAANGLLNAPPPTVPAAPTPSEAATASTAASSATTTAAVALGRSLTDLVQRLLILLVMCVAGSIIASLGIRLYFSARSAAANAADQTPPPSSGGSVSPASSSATANGHIRSSGGASSSTPAPAAAPTQHP